jgi:hypothetical protein
MTHRFRPGQRVRFTRFSPYRNAAEGSYEIVRQLPPGEGENQYRIRSEREQHERVVKESDLEAA